jgi:hypothetical protein
MSQSSSTNLEDLITSTLEAIEVTGEDCQRNCEIVPDQDRPNKLSSQGLGAENDVDTLLSQIRQAAPKPKVETGGDASSFDDIDALMDSLISPQSLVESMEALSLELRSFLDGKDESTEDNRRYKMQLAIYKDVSAAFKLNPGILEEQSSEGDRVRARLAELQSLGSPPQEVVEKLMLSDLSSSGADSNIAKEFESFLKEASEGGFLPGISKEDEEMLKKLSQDPNALKNLLGTEKPGTPGDCSLM